MPKFFTFTPGRRRPDRHDLIVRDTERQRATDHELTMATYLRFVRLANSSAFAVWIAGDPDWPLAWEMWRIADKCPVTDCPLDSAAHIDFPVARRVELEARLDALFGAMPGDPNKLGAAVKLGLLGNDLTQADLAELRALCGLGAIE